MARVSPMSSLHRQVEALVWPYGPAEDSVDVVATFGDLELEYAALRKQCVVLDRPQRGVLRVTGGDRVEFLQRMLTQDLRGFDVGGVRPTFWLNRKGRIDADMMVVQTPEATLLDVDVHAAVRAREGLEAFIIADDVVIEDCVASTHRMALHGPTALDVLHRVGDMTWGEPPRTGSACGVRIAGHDAVVYRDDSAGEIGFELTVDARHALTVYQALLDEGARPTGWHAYNIARIEAGHPLYYIDFGPDSLPHETGIIRDRVSFTKGCYLGQEIVARLEARGTPKQILRGLRLTGDAACDECGEPRQPETGATVVNDAQEAIGAVTSSCVSPMLGATAVCFAMLKYVAASPGTRVRIDAQGTLVEAVVQDSLVFWRRPIAL